MSFTEVHIKCGEELKEILIAELDFAGADSVLEENGTLLASFIKDQFEEGLLKQMSMDYKFSYELKDSEKINWNKEWEKNFDQLIIKNCSVRASFHKKPAGVDFDIVINPKMSFGTGHHETTTLMVEELLRLDLNGKSVLDMGTGTGILAILAEKKGAKNALGIDNDDWSVENATENIGINECKNTTIQLGDSETLNNLGKFDVVIANINRNVLLDDIKVYSNHLVSGGALLLSGFYKRDNSMIIEECVNFELEEVSASVNNNWSQMNFKRN